MGIGVQPILGVKLCWLVERVPFCTRNDGELNGGTWARGSIPPTSSFKCDQGDTTHQPFLPMMCRIPTEEPSLLSVVPVSSACRPSMSAASGFRNSALLRRDCATLRARALAGGSARDAGRLSPHSAPRGDVGRRNALCGVALRRCIHTQACCARGGRGP
jgi:hypothetical protein